jgi:hypothetical protein
MEDFQSIFKRKISPNRAVAPLLPKTIFSRLQRIASRQKPAREQPNILVDLSRTKACRALARHALTQITFFESAFTFSGYPECRW